MITDSGNIMTGFARRAERAVRRYGVIGMLSLAAGHIRQLMARLRPSVRIEIREREQRAADFDQRFGVDTAGLIHPTELNIDHADQLHAVSYRGSDPKFFRYAVGALPIDYRTFVFVDFGSGKGRALLLASEFPFKRIVGVEFSKDLHKIAQNNIKAFPWDHAKCKDVESVYMDATSYPLPDDRVVCYFCNPFDAVVMTQVMRNIQNSFLRNPRDMFVVYYNPKEAHVIDQSECFKRSKTIGPIVIWQTMVES